MSGEMKLPEPALYDWSNELGHITYSIYPPMHVPANLRRYYTADQLRQALAEEREACAKLCDDVAAVHQREDGTYPAGKKAGAFDCAAAIRSRNNSPAE